MENNEIKKPVFKYQYRIKKEVIEITSSGEEIIRITETDFDIKNKKIKKGERYE